MPEQNYIESDCTIEHNGKRFTYGGAIVTPDYVIAYTSAERILRDWHGNPIGTWGVVAKWEIPGIAFSRQWMFQIEAVVNGVTYTGRGQGESMVYKGKRKARQPARKE